MIPGGKRDSQSFGEVKVSNKTHEVTKRPATGMYHYKYPLTMAQYANIEHGEVVAPVSHIHHEK
jgi:hypothetical protein